jgi:hypothetical protein
MIEMWQSTNSVQPKGKCINVIGNYMGYRFQILDGKLEKSAKSGATFCASLNIKNSGSASLYSKRPVEVLMNFLLLNCDLISLVLKIFFQVILINVQSSKQYGPFVQKGIDPRKIAPGQTKAIDLSVTLPSDIPAGKYTVNLNLPDESPKLKNVAAYRILFANGGNVQDKKNRFNVIGQITIN